MNNIFLFCLPTFYDFLACLFSSFFQTPVPRAFSNQKSIIRIIRIIIPLVRPLGVREPAPVCRKQPANRSQRGRGGRLQGSLRQPAPRWERHGDWDQILRWFSLFVAKIESMYLRSWLYPEENATHLLIAVTSRVQFCEPEIKQLITWLFPQFHCASAGWNCEPNEAAQPRKITLKYIVRKYYENYNPKKRFLNGGEFNSLKNRSSK